MQDSNYISVNLKFPKKNIIIMFFLSLAVVALYVCFIAYREGTLDHYEANIAVPLTSQGELATFYRQSKYVNFRVRLFGGENYFTNATVYLTTKKSSEAESIKADLYKYLSDYYSARDKGLDPEGLQQLKDQLTRFQMDLTNGLAFISEIKAKYPAFQPAALLSQEVNVVSLEGEIKRLKKSLKAMRDFKVEMIDFKKTPNNLSLKNVIIKLVIIFLSSFAFLFCVQILIPQSRKRLIIE